MFTAKVFKYPDGYQVRIYKRAVMETSKGDYYPGEAPEKEKEFNPFTNRKEVIPDLPDKDRSARVSLARTKQKIYYLTRSNTFQWFVTLTFNPEKVNSFDYDECVTHLSDWLSNAKKKCPGMKYIVVPEMHKSGRWHFHGLFSHCSELGFVDSGHCSRGGQTIFNIGTYRLGWTTATEIIDVKRCARYICKYITKTLCVMSFGRRRYWASRNLDKAEIKSAFIQGGSKNLYMDYLKEFTDYIKTMKSVFNEVTYIDLFLSDSIDISPFVDS